MKILEILESKESTHTYLTLLGHEYHKYRTTYTDVLNQVTNGISTVESARNTLSLLAMKILDSIHNVDWQSMVADDADAATAYDEFVTLYNEIYDYLESTK